MLQSCRNWGDRPVPRPGWQHRTGGVHEYHQQSRSIGAPERTVAGRASESAELNANPGHNVAGTPGAGERSIPQRVPEANASSGSIWRRSYPGITAYGREETTVAKVLILNMQYRQTTYLTWVLVQAH